MKKTRKEETELINRFINDLATESEIHEVEEIFISGESNAFLKQLLEHDWNNEESEKKACETNLNLLLDRIHHEIRSKEYRNSQTPFYRVVSVYTKVAAIILFPLFILGGLYYSFMGGKNLQQTVTSQIYAPLGSRVSFILPDSTKGMLNSGSTLSYVLPFNSRNVILEGEAWFEVKHDVKHPFKIIAGESKVTVLGTSFNLNAYPSENYIEVVLKEGVVKFAGNNIGSEVTLMPSERLVCKDGVITKTITDTDKYSAWTTGKLIFRGDPMAEVIRRIERWYNVKITLAEKELEKYSFRATFEDDSVEEVMKFLSMTSPIDYEIISRKILPDGTLGKMNIIIKAKK